MPHRSEKGRRRFTFHGDACENVLTQRTAAMHNSFRVKEDGEARQSNRHMHFAGIIQLPPAFISQAASINDPLITTACSALPRLDETFPQPY
ncbi:hypothetical protein PPNSA23_24310 [Phyllobacterium phragmitis]|uniref:Uncharacterized protein n=1 Tax=Phyllobacterium phragmitis TaxID=2670329 RepID=A0ABQ0H0N9_9HYPH